MSRMRRQLHRQHMERRAAEQAARCRVVAACHAVRSCGVAMVDVTRHLTLSDRTVRRWRQQGTTSSVKRRGRPPRCASREERDVVYRFLKERGPVTPLAALQVAFLQLRRADLKSVLRRFKRVMKRRAERHQSRLEWRRPGAVWAADFKERREPLEGRYGWILAVKDLGSGCQLAWEPLVEATAEAVCALYERLFAEHGPPLILKSDNGGQFKADETKAILAIYDVLPLYSPKRHPQYNGGIERSHGPMVGYQEALAQFHNRPAGPILADAAAALQIANDQTHPHGWRGPTARQLWEQRTPITPDERAAFLATVTERRAMVRAQWEFAPDAVLAHYPSAAVDRRAVRDALLAHDLLKIHPRRKRRSGPASFSDQTGGTQEVAPALADAITSALRTSGAPNATDSLAATARLAMGAGTIHLTTINAPPTVGRAPNLGQRLLALVNYLLRGGPFLR